MASLENVTFWACSADICACSRFQPAMPIQHVSKLAWISGVCAVWYSVGRSSASHIDPEAACSKGLWVRPQLSKASQDVSAGLDRAGFLWTRELSLEIPWWHHDPYLNTAVWQGQKVSAYAAFGSPDLTLVWGHFSTSLMVSHVFWF